LKSFLPFFFFFKHIGISFYKKKETSHTHWPEELQ